MFRNAESLKFFILHYYLLFKTWVYSDFYGENLPLNAVKILPNDGAYAPHTIRKISGTRQDGTGAVYSLRACPKKEKLRNKTSCFLATNKEER